MDKRSTILWRLAGLGLFVSLIPLGILAPDRYARVNVNSMLDSSVTIRTISHVTVDKYGDSVWEVSANRVSVRYTAGEGSSRMCVHVAAGVAVH